MSAETCSAAVTIVLGALLLAACATTARITLRSGAAALSEEWTRSRVAGSAIAEHHAHGGTIAASVSCDAVDEDAPLDVLVNHVLMQLDGAIEESRRSITLDGRAALRVRLAARLDGVHIALDLVVLKKDGCVVDAQLAADERVMAQRIPDFERFLAGIEVSRRPR